MNHIVLMGRLTRDPELRQSAAGNDFCTFALAVDRRGRKDQEKQTDFIDCTAFGKTAVFVNTYFHKGDGMMLSGRMESRKWVDKEGNNRVSWGVSVDNVEFTPGKSGGASSGASYAPSGFAPVAPSEDDGELPF